MEKIKLPKFTREDNHACKLKDKQIAEIRELRKTGKFYTTIAKMYKVSKNAIRYWCVSEEERKKIIKAANQKAARYGYKKISSQDRKDRYRRKKELYPKEIIIYHKWHSKKYSWRDYYNKNRGKILVYRRAYNIRNMEKIRLYAKEYHKRKKEIKLLQNMALSFSG